MSFPDNNSSSSQKISVVSRGEYTAIAGVAGSVDEQFVSDFGAGFTGAINFASAPVFEPSETYPRNCVWFKPHISGTCVLSFARQSNKQNNEYAAVYRYLRDSEGNYLAKQEICIDMVKGAVKNANTLYIEIAISEEDIAAGWEYCIGRSENESTTSSAVFTYLILGHNDKLGPGTSTAGMIEKIDFMDSIPHNPDIWAGTEQNPYNVHQNIFQFTTSESGTILFDTAGGEVIVTGSDNITVTDMLKQ